MLIIIGPDTDYMLLERSDQKTYASAVNYDDLAFAFIERKWKTNSQHWLCRMLTMKTTLNTATNIINNFFRSCFLFQCLICNTFQLNSIRISFVSVIVCLCVCESLSVRRKSANLPNTSLSFV